MLPKVLVVLVFLGIVASLASGFIYVLRDRGNSKRVVKALTVRVGLSVSLFLLLFVMYFAGIIEPHGIRPG